MLKIRSLLRYLFSFFGIWRFVHWLRRTKFLTFLFYRNWQRQIYIIRERERERIKLPVVNFFLSHRCNLKCEYCEYFNPFRIKIPSKEELLDSIDVWSKRIEPKLIVLAGGEPLLNPDYEEIVIATRKAWQDAVIDIISNGVLVPKVRDEFLATMAEQNIGFTISRHLKTEQYTNNLNRSIQRFKIFGVRYDIVESFDAWVACHELDNNGVPKPSKSNPQLAWSQCLPKYCTSINGHELHRCSTLMNIRLAVQEGVLSSIWNEFATHEGVSVDQPLEEIMKYLKSGVMKECRVCPDKIIGVPSRQMQPDELKVYKLILSGQTNDSNDENIQCAG
jgi:organic radical activating enzyme